MRNLTQIINEVLRDLLPQHLVRLITPKLVEALNDNGIGVNEG